MHRIGEIMDFFQFIRRDISRGRIQKRRNPVDDRRAGMFYRRGLYDVELGVRLARNPPVAHISVAGAVYFADRFLFDHDALIRFDRDDCRHTDTSARLDLLSERFAVNVFIHDIRNVFLLNGFDRQAELIADRLRRVPSVGGHDFRRMRKFLFKLLFRQIAAVRFGEGKAVFVHVIAVCPLDLRDIIAP